MKALVDKGQDRLVVEVLQKILHKQVRSWMDVIELSNEGVTKNSLMTFMKLYDFTPKQFSHMLPITERTIQRYSSNQKFTPAVSEHIIQLVFVMAEGMKVFGSREKFMRWFDSPSTALGGKVPRELVSLKTGAQMVMDELGRIEYGVYA